MASFTYHIPLATQKFARKKPVGRWYFRAITEEFVMAPIHSHSVLPQVMNVNNLNLSSHFSMEDWLEALDLAMILHTTSYKYL